jgi:hypothetical protein
MYGQRDPVGRHWKRLQLPSSWLGGGFAVSCFRGRTFIETFSYLVKTKENGTDQFYVIKNSNNKKNERESWSKMKIRNWWGTLWLNSGANKLTAKSNGILNVHINEQCVCSNITDIILQICYIYCLYLVINSSHDFHFVNCVLTISMEAFYTLDRMTALGYVV